MFEKNKVKVYVMREVFVIAFSMFPLPLPQQKRKTTEQKRPARKETTVFPARAPVRAMVERCIPLLPRPPFSSSSGLSYQHLHSWGKKIGGAFNVSIFGGGQKKRGEILSLFPRAERNIFVYNILLSFFFLRWRCARRRRGKGVIGLDPHSRK